MNKYLCFHFSTIQFSLSILLSSRKSYEILQQHLVLPSITHLIKYKNFISQKPGFNAEHLDWMLLEANKKNISEKGRHGCLIIDEMLIQVRNINYYMEITNICQHISCQKETFRFSMHRVIHNGVRLLCSDPIFTFHNSMNIMVVFVLNGFRITLISINSPMFAL